MEKKKRDGKKGDGQKKRRSRKKKEIRKQKGIETKKAKNEENLSRSFYLDGWSVPRRALGNARF